MQYSLALGQQGCLRQSLLGEKRQTTSPLRNRNFASVVFATELRASCMLGKCSATTKLGRSPALHAPTRKSKKMSQQAALSSSEQALHYRIKKTTKIIL